MKKNTPQTSPTINLIIILIILVESAALVYLYKQYRSQRLTTVAIQNTLTRTMETVHALQKDVADKAQVAPDMERRSGESGPSGRAIPEGQDAAYLRKRLKESKEMELQMYERIEELSRKQAELESDAAKPSVAAATPTPPPTPTDTAVAPPPVPTATATTTNTPIPQATATPVAQEPLAAEPAGPGEVAPAGEITGQILIMNETHNFIIISVGSEDGIEAGDEGIIDNDGAQIGRAKVKKLYNKMCLADVIETSPETKIQKNYLVKFSREPENKVR